MAGCGCIDCTDITIPTGSTGATGPQGATGAAGADGSNGVAVLSNDITNSATIGTSLEILKTYTVPAATLTTDGSLLKIIARFSTPTASASTSTKFCGIYFNGSLIQGYTFNTANIDAVEFEIDINRFSNVSIKTKAKGSPIYFGLPFVAATLVTGYVTSGGLNLTTTAYDITTKANSDVIGDVVCESLQVIKYVK